MLTKSRYNQHTGKYANIIEVGATGNTLEQCLTSMKYLSAVMNEVINEWLIKRDSTIIQIYIKNYINYWQNKKSWI